MRGAIAALGMAALLTPAVAAAQEAAPALDASPAEAVAPADPAAAQPDSAPTAAEEIGDDSGRDPWEGFNRGLFAVHNVVDRAVLEPVARGYRAVTPSPVRDGVRNFLRNLRAPVIFVNDMLQGEPRRAGVTAARFGLNTTVGVLGILDPATQVGLERHDEDFGQTLAVWGVDAGPYIFVPVLGPTTLRDGFGKVVDIGIDPITWSDFDGEEAFIASRTVVDGVSTREGLLDAVDGVRATSIDPYVTFRTTYLTLRAGQIANGEEDINNLPSFDDTFETEEPAAEPSSPPSETAPESGPAPSGENPQHSEINETSFLTATLEGERDAPTSAQQTGELP